MKKKIATFYSLTKSLTVSLLLLFAMACSSEEEPVPQIDSDGEIVESDGITEDDIETYAGDLGIVLEARQVALKGYLPTTMEVTVNASSGDFSETLAVDPYTMMSQIKLAIEDLNDEQENELKEGVEVVVELLDERGSSIVEQTFSKVSFQSNPAPTSIAATNLEDLDTEVHLKANTPYYMQLIDIEEKAPIKKAVTYNTIPLAAGHISQTVTVDFTGDEDNLLFFFEAIPETVNTYAIRHKATGKYLRIHRNYIGYPTGDVFRPAIHQAIVADLDWEFPEDFLTGSTDARFVIEKEDDGMYYLQSVQGERVKVAPGVGYTLNHPGSTNIAVNFVPMNIGWAVENIETRYLEPILPPAKNGFSYNSTLINCGQGGLSQTIGSSRTETTTTTVGWQETVSLTSSHSAGGSITLGMEVSGNFFGNGATYSASATADYNYTTTSTTDNTNWEEASGTTSETFFSERTITVPPKSASLVYDAFQSYDNIKVNVVQRLRVRGTEHNTGEALSGEEISSQFHFNGFKGITTEVGSDYIEITLRGVATMDKVFDSQSEVQEVAANCGG